MSTRSLWCSEVLFFAFVSELSSFFPPVCWQVTERKRKLRAAFSWLSAKGKQTFVRRAVYKWRQYVQRRKRRNLSLNFWYDSTVSKTFSAWYALAMSRRQQRQTLVSQQWSKHAHIPRVPVARPTSPGTNPHQPARCFVDMSFGPQLVDFTNVSRPLYAANS